MRNYNRLGMTKSDYVIRQADTEDCPIIDSGESSFFIVEKELVPKGYLLNSVQNSPKLKTIYVVSF